MTTSNDLSLTQILSFIQAAGVLGLLIAIIWSGYKGIWLWKHSQDQLLERAVKAESERDRLHGLIETKVIPALEASNKVQQEALTQLSSWRDEVKDLIRDVRELVREIAELRNSRGSGN